MGELRLIICYNWRPYVFRRTERKVIAFLCVQVLRIWHGFEYVKPTFKPVEEYREVIPFEARLEHNQYRIASTRLCPRSYCKK